MTNETQTVHDARPVLRVTDLSIVDDYDDVLVHDSTFTLHRGERLGIVGESGSGKSLTLKALIGILPKSLHARGGIEYVDPLTRTDAAMIFQEPATSLNPTMRVGRFVARTWQVHHPDDSWESCQAHAIDLMSKVGIADAKDKMTVWPFELSGGLRQRIMIAAALAAEPSILLCDEPTTALDVRVQAQILKLLKDIAERDNLSLIFVSHDLAVISEICDRVIVMQYGRIMEQGSTRGIIHDPQQDYTKKLLDADLDYRMRHMDDVVNTANGGASC
ncbi:ABC transporter ATP-binding protein [Bifidobacterium callimiconis]|uniref:Peptide ABC transporter ATPase n=1 Tax=Bifidobacterium callimiconis TaxID=2306973 RepID=A0A430FGU9_9BIFI|nr:ABC transporter ATP-binding protein [Bifidobacterium callimiconis]RSX52076.1 peptide ABC transporter ATPase [Bifidobacterium callimiconis]